MKPVRVSAVILVACFAAACLSRGARAEEPKAAESDFQSIFDGRTLKGWHASAQTGHSGASGHKSGGRWVVENGAIVGSQDIPGNGGILLTDEQFGDFEVVLEMNNDFGPDSGLFLRSAEDGTSYQAMIDYHVGGNLMGLYGEERLGARPNLRNFTFLDRPERIKLVTEVNGVRVPVPFPMPLEDWPKFWRHGQWNDLRARIVGNPPHVTTWVKGVMFMDWTESEKRHPDKGGIGLQLHGGGNFTKQYVRYRNIRVKRLDGTGVAGSLQPFIDDHVLAGAVALVASPEKVLSLEAVGYADIAAKKPMRTDSLFWIASMSKPITATALMMLVDEGKVGVNDPVEKYLPEFKGQMVRVEEQGKVSLRKPARPVTVKNLLTHTSGLTNNDPRDSPSLREAVERYAATPLKFEPGSKFEYNNPGINTVGRIIEVASGMPYEQFMARRLFQPLGMNDTTFWPTLQQVQRLATTYMPNADRTGLLATTTLPFIDPRTGHRLMPFPAGGLFSTASDLSLFCRMILGGGVLEGKRYLSEASLREMTSTQTAGLPAAYGYGWFTGREPAGSFGHGGAHKTDMRIFPDKRLLTVLMVQHTDWRNAEGAKILPAFYQAAIKTFAK